jgi:hypothetical protein
LLKLILPGSLPVMNSERYLPRCPLPHSTRQPQQQQSQRRLLLREISGKQPAATAEQKLASKSSSQQAKAGRAELRAEEAANKSPIGRPEEDCHGLTILLWGHLGGTAVMHKHEGEAVWQGEDERGEGVGEEDQAVSLAHAEQVAQTRPRLHAPKQHHVRVGRG